MCVWLHRFQMVRRIRLLEYSTRLYRMCPGPRWDTEVFDSISTLSASFEIVLLKKSFSLFSPGVLVCVWMNICIFANVYGVLVRSGCVHGWSAVVPRTHAGVCWRDDGERTATQAARRRTGYTPGGVNTDALFRNQFHISHGFIFSRISRFLDMLCILKIKCSNVFLLIQNFMSDWTICKVYWV